MADQPQVICAYCKHDIRSGPKGCERSVVVIKGERFPRIKCLDNECVGCGAPRNRYHHHSCPAEVCPKCWEYILDECRCNDEPTEAARGEGQRYTILRSAGLEPAQAPFIYDRQEQAVLCLCYGMEVATRVCVALNRDEAGKESPPSLPGKVSGGG